MRSPNHISNSRIDGAGFGVFAGKDFSKDSLIDVSPFIEIDEIESENLISSYIFKSHLDENKYLVVFGNGSLFNHSDSPNIFYSFDESRPRLLFFYALRPLKKGEELFISYGEGHSKYFDWDYD